MLNKNFWRLKTNARLIPFALLSLMVALILSACGDNTATNTVASTTVAATTVAATKAATTAAATTAAATTAAATTAAATTAAGTTVAATTVAATKAATTAAATTAAATTAAAGTGNTSAILPAGLDGTALKADLNGSGATFPNPVIKIWQTEFGKAVPNVKINYPGGGSGQGRSDFLTGKTDFGGSDVQITDAEAKQNNKNLADIIHIPWTLGAVVFAYNLPGVTELNLSQDVAAGIYTGKITKWSDPKIKADNPNATLPDTAITFAVRADSSGTSQIFSTYLSAISPEFKTAVGGVTQPKWEAAGINVTTAPGNDGVAGLVKQAPGTLGYIELAYALQNNIAYANVKNPAGKFVKPSLDSISAAAATAKLDDNFQIDLINQAGENAYPVSATSYGLFSKSYTDKAKGEAMVGFLWYVLHKGQEDAKAANYAPLPAAIVTKIEEQVKKITVAGAPVIK